MKKIEFYEKQDPPLRTEEEIFDYFFNTIIPHIKGWNYFVDVDKVKENAQKYLEVLSVLNPLCETSNFDKDLKNILKKNQNVIKAIPSLLAARNSETFEPLDDTTLQYPKIYNFDKNTYTDNDIDSIVDFFEKSHLKQLIRKFEIKNFENYFYGVEVGLNTHARKNKGGTRCEDIIEGFLTDSYSLKKDEDFSRQVSGKKAKDLWQIKFPTKLEAARPDFIIKGKKNIFWVEVNFFTVNGSKPQINRVYNDYADIIKKANGDIDGFILITDGSGWEKNKDTIKSAFHSLDYVFNLTMVKNGILNDIIN